MIISRGTNIQICRVSGGGQSIPNAANTRLRWSVTNIIDPLGCFNAALDNTIITVPQGFSQAKARCNIGFFASGVGDRLLYSFLNAGGKYGETTNSTFPSAAQPCWLVGETGWFSIVAGDVFHWEIFQSSGGALFTTLGADNWFEVEFRQ